MTEQLTQREPSGVTGPSPVADGLERLGVALADPIRRSVLISLLDGARCPSDLADELGTSRPNLSNHLACLRGCGLVRAERAGRHLHYELVSDRLAEVIRSIVALAADLPACDTHLEPAARVRGAS